MSGQRKKTLSVKQKTSDDDDFVTLETGINDTKMPMPVLTSKASMSRAMGLAKSGDIRKGVSATLTARLTQRSGASAAFNTVTSLTPSSCGEFSTFATLFDEMIVDKVVFKFVVAATGAVFADNVFGALAFDPLNNGAYTSVAGACEAQRHVLFPFFNTIGTGLGALNGEAKMHTFSMPIPKAGSGRSAAAAANFSGQWSATTDTSDVYGYMKPYFEAGPASGVTTCNGFLFYHCRFRMRS